MTSDAALVQAAKGGDEQAFAAVVREFAPRLVRYLEVTGVPHHDAEDLVQDTFVRVHAHLAQYDERWAFSTWIFTIANRLRISWAKSARARRHGDLGAHPEPVAPAVGEVGEERAWAIARRVLDERAFRLLWLRYGEDLSVADAARSLDITSLHARVLLHRARSRLQPHLAGLDDAMTARPSCETH